MPAPHAFQCLVGYFGTDSEEVVLRWWHYDSLRFLGKNAAVVAVVLCTPQIGGFDILSLSTQFTIGTFKSSVL
jgi:hypothetical protein